jgi:hypothetical protein
VDFLRGQSHLVAQSDYLIHLVGAVKCFDHIASLPLIKSLEFGYDRLDVSRSLLSLRISAFEWHPKLGDHLIIEIHVEVKGIPVVEMFLMISAKYNVVALSVIAPNTFWSS